MNRVINVSILDIASIIIINVPSLFKLITLPLCTKYTTMYQIAALTIEKDPLNPFGSMSYEIYLHDRFDFILTRHKARLQVSC